MKKIILNLFRLNFPEHTHVIRLSNRTFELSKDSIER